MIGSLSKTVNLSGLKKLQRKSPKAFNKAMKIGAIQFLTWANTGQGGVSNKKPPIRFGVLRGSASAFVGGKLVQVYPQPIKAGADESPTPARSHSAPEDQITWVWNTDYATKMHEWKGGWGKFTQQDMNAGNKWLEDHLKADKKALRDVIGMEFKKELGL
jgi:hypothetical protein